MATRRQMQASRIAGHAAAMAPMLTARDAWYAECGGADRAYAEEIRLTWGRSDVPPHSTTATVAELVYYYEWLTREMQLHPKDGA